MGISAHSGVQILSGITCALGIYLTIAGSYIQLRQTESDPAAGILWVAYGIVFLAVSGLLMGWSAKLK